MSDDNGSKGADGTGWPNWLKWGLGAAAVVAAVTVLVYLSGFIFKWALILLALYVLFVAGRKLLSGSSTEEAEEPKLLTGESEQPDPLLELEQEQELEAFKARLEADDRSE
ncbi:MAG: hypothetical protein ACLFVJ_17800 [Persicimonas sp.]